ncbi:MAG: arginyltransferase [Acidobacteria bacterium]|nr:arginyltransferase [Acidobacteriota bacterium]
MSDFSHYPAVPHPLVLDVPVMPEEPCPYLPERLSRYRAFRSDVMPPRLYHQLMDVGFRRSGDVFYQPVCKGCRACVPLRVPVQEFAASKSQRRVWRRNMDLEMTVGAATVTEEKVALYRRYAEAWHGRDGETAEDYERFLVLSPVTTVEFSYRDGAGRLLAVGICDVCEQSLSSVYFYFDPEERARSLGTFGAMAEIAYAASRGIPYYYLGYWVEGSEAMCYKSRFRPFQVLQTDGKWA